MTLLAELRRRFPYRNPAQLLAGVLCGEVFVDDGRVNNPKCSVSPGATIEFRRKRYVSRGGEKLEAALAAFRVVPAAGIFVDAGASTGGFTDCLLKHGAALVHAVDVGMNQLAAGLRDSPRVRAMEGTNIMDVEKLEPPPSGAVCDISFRGVRPVVAKLLSLTGGGEAVVLVKPQFELSSGLHRGITAVRPPEDFDGVLRDDETIVELLRDIVSDLTGEGIAATGWLLSPLRGQKGNREIFFRFVPGESLRSDRPRRALDPKEISLKQFSTLSEGIP